MAAIPGGYASPADLAQRAEKLRRLYAEGLSLPTIATRLGMSGSAAAKTATQLGLRRPLARRRAAAPKAARP